MTKKKDKDSLTGSGIMTSESGATTDEATSTPETSQSPQEASQNPSPPPNPPPLPPIDNPIKRRRGRPPGSQSKPKPQQEAKPSETVTLTIPRDALVSIARSYSGLLVSVGLDPELGKDEREAIVDSLDAVAKQYGGGFEHWPLVALTMALATPVGVRIAAKRHQAKQQQQSEPVAFVEEIEKPNQGLGNPLAGFGPVQT